MLIGMVRPTREELDAAIDCILEALQVLSPDEKVVEYLLEDALTLLGYGE